VLLAFAAAELCNDAIGLVSLEAMGDIAAWRTALTLTTLKPAETTQKQDSVYRTHGPRRPRRSPPVPEWATSPAKDTRANGKQRRPLTPNREMNNVRKLWPLRQDHSHTGRLLWPVAAHY